MKSAAVFTALCFGLSCAASDVSANPQFSHAEAGDIRIEESGAVYNIYSADRSIGAFNSFSNSAGETINSIQAAADHSVIFKVIGQSPSEIFGALNANSRVFLVNPNGIIFQPGSQVNAPGLVAAAMDLKSADFDSREFTFEAPVSGGYVLNEGNHSASPGGYIALVGSAVENSGVISAPGGTVALASGGAATVGLDGDGGISVKVTKALESPVYDLQGNAIQDGLKNSGTLSAAGGAVLLTADAMDEVFDQAINHTGVIEAQTVEEKSGVILLSSGGKGVVALSGQVDASGADAGEKGGEIRVTGEYVGLFEGARVTASGDVDGGTVLVGGDYKGENSQIPNSTAAFFGPDAVIRADAFSSGDGGKVILWSDNSTRAYGTISAIGGLGGSGGFVETSGKNYLSVQGARVQAGEWLLDPSDITITTTSPSTGGSFGGSNPNTWTPSGSSNVYDVDIETSLNAGTNVIINTPDGTGNDITVNASILKNEGGDASLTLNSGEDIFISTSNSITSTSGKLNVTLNAGSAGTLINIDSAITTNGGNFTALTPIGSINLAAVPNLLNLTSGNASLTATTGGIAVADPTVNNLTEIKTTGSVTLSATMVGTTPNRLTLENVTSLVITDRGAGDMFIGEKSTFPTILSTNITVMTISAGAIDIDYDGADQININTNQTISSVSLGRVGSSFTYTASTGLLTATAINTNGSVNLSSLVGGINAPSITTADGGITLNATGGSLTIGTITAVGTGRNISLTTSTSGDVLINNVTAFGDIITINSVGAIQENGGDPGADLTAQSAHLMAGTGIGGGPLIEMDLDILTLAQVTGTGLNYSIDLQDLDDLIVTNATTYDGAITINSATTLQVNNASSDTGVAGAHNISMTNTAGDMTIGAITSDNNVTLTAVAGHILDGNGPSLNVTAAGTGIADFNTSAGHDVGTPSNFIEVNAYTTDILGVGRLSYICAGTGCDPTESAAEVAGLLLEGNRVVGGENFEEFASDSSSTTESMEESGQDESQEEGTEEEEGEGEGDEEEDSSSGGASGQSSAANRLVSPPASFPDEKPVQPSTFAPCAA